MTTETASTPDPATDQRLPTRFRAWAAALPKSAKLAITVAVLVNVVLLAGYLWSRPGQTTHVRFEARDDSFTAYVDGRVQQSGKFDGPPQGGVLIAVEDTKALPSLPQPSGVDSVRITDLDTGQLLYANDFSEPPAATSIYASLSAGTLTVRGGVLEARTPPSVSGGAFSEVFMRIEGADWRNYAVDVTYRNITTGIIRVRATPDASGVEYALRPFRHLDTRLSLFRDGKNVDNRGGPTVETSKTETARSMVAMVLRPYPVMLLLLVAGFCVVAVLQLVPLRRRASARPQGQAGLAQSAVWLAPAVLAGAAFALLLFYNYSYGSHMPHVPDEVSYLFQAKVLAAGHLTAPVPPVADSFRLGSPPLIVVTDGNWASLYPFGHPLMLAIGARIGAVWLIPPLVGAASIVLLFAIGRKLYNVRVGLLAAVLFAASPFFLMTAQNFMSHNTAAFYLLTSILLLAYADRRPLLFPLLSGVFVGLVFNTRQLTGAALVIPFGLLLVTFAFPVERRRLGLKQIGAFAVGGALMLVAYLAYRTGTLGSPLASGGIQSGKDQLGFAGAHSVSIGIGHERTQLTFLVMMLSNWPVIIGFMFVLLPFALGTRNRWDWFLLMATVFLMGVYTLYYVDGFMHGPRFWYETTPLLLLLTARGADMAAAVIAGAASRARALVPPSHPPPLWDAVVVVYVFVLVLAYVGWRDWAIGDGAQWRTDDAPSRAQELRGFNGVDDRLVRQVERLHPQNALVIVGECPSWQCYGNVDWLNSPWLDGDVVFARDLPERNGALFQAFPDRVVYSARYEGPPLLVPYDGKPVAPDATASAAGTEPRTAGSFPTPTPLAPNATVAAPAAVVPTPVNPADAIARDEQRKQRLDAIAAALDQYHAAHGNYPVSGGLQSLCTYPNDAGCALKEVLDPLPVDPTGGGAVFAYRSADGAHFTLFAHFEGPAPPSQCPPDATAEQPQVENLYCVTK